MTCLTGIERTNVYDTYGKISSHFDKTRHHVWPCVRDFLDTLSIGSSLLEIGCGNGKNLLYRSDLDSTGIDFVPSFVSICREKGLAVIEGNAIDLPYSNDSFDTVISVAVFHHLSSEERRQEALREMYRVLKPGGQGLVVCWAYEQNICHAGEQLTSGHYRTLKDGDQYVDWQDKTTRYYYCYNKDLFEKYTSCISPARKDIWWQKGNWILQFTKS
jgi:ubiquinone/menaquinone biosynthesis C-methylase UbiE